MSMNKTRIYIIAGLAALFVLSAALVILGPGRAKPTPPAVTLSLWDIGNHESEWQAILESYRRLHQNVTIVYRAVQEEGYEGTIVNALAAGRGPDIFVIRDAWIIRQRDKIAPLPADSPLFAARDLVSSFAEIASENLVTPQGEIIGAPLSVDTLALFYNRDKFNAAGIAEPPKTWDDVASLSRRSARVTPVGDILATGLAMGTGVNTDHATDILSALILQKGDPIVRRGGTNAVLLGSGAGEALAFYASFADRSAQNYSWNRLKGSSLDAFAEERAAMAIGYANDIPRLYEKNPHLNLGVAPFPQFADMPTPVTYGSFSFPVVSKASRNIGAAWKFLAYLASHDGATLYAEHSGRAPLRRDVIATGPHSGSAGDDAVLEVLYRAALTAKNWPIPNEDAVSRIFETMIDGVLAKTITPNEALGRARQQMMNLFSAPQ